VNVGHPSRDDLAAYAIGAGEPREERAVSSHAPSCEHCTRELRALAPAVAVLGESVEQLEPPPELRERIMDVVRREAGARDQARAETQRRTGSRIGASLLRPATGLAALAVAGAGVAGYLVNDHDGEGETTVPISETQPGIGGSLEVRDDSAMLSVRGMPRLAKGSVYQVWIAEGSSLRPSSSFVPDRSGSATAAVPEALPAGSRVLVSSEPRPGRATPSSPPLLSATVD
jgi:anti-sigma-K factor RskA